MFKKTSYRISETHPIKWERNRKGAKIRNFGILHGLVLNERAEHFFSIFIPLYYTQVDKV